MKSMETDLQTISVTINESDECIKCGACCRPELVGRYDMLDDNGKCKYLDENNKCRIYETRPDICRSDNVYINVYKKNGVTVEEYLAMKKKACETLRSTGNV